MAEAVKRRNSFAAGRKANGNYHGRDILARLEDEILIRSFSAQRGLPLASSPADLREELRILRDAHAEIERLRGGGA